MRKVFLISFIFLALLLGGCSNSQKNALTLTGSIEGSSTNISAEMSSKIVDLKKSEGDLVKPGEIVYLLDSKTLQIQKSQIENQLMALEVQVKMAKDSGNNNNVRLVEYNLKAAQKSLDIVNNDIEALNSTKNISQTNNSSMLNAIDSKSKEDNLLKLKLQREQVQNQIDALKLQLSNIKSTSSNSVKLAEYNYKAAQKSLDIINENIKKCSVLAPVGGIITNTNFKKGEIAQMGAQLFTVMDNKYLYLKVYVPERYLNKFNVNDSINIIVPTISSKSFTGKVIKIDEQGQFTPRNTETVDEKSNIVFGIKLQLEGNNTLKPGMIGEVKLSE